MRACPRSVCYEDRKPRKVELENKTELEKQGGENTKPIKRPMINGSIIPSR